MWYDVVSNNRRKRCVNLGIKGIVVRKCALERNIYTVVVVFALLPSKMQASKV